MVPLAAAALTQRIFGGNDYPLYDLKRVRTHLRQLLRQGEMGFIPRLTKDSLFPWAPNEHWGRQQTSTVPWEQVVSALDIYKFARGNTERDTIIIKIVSFYD